MNWMLRKSMLSVTGLVLAGGAVAGPAVAAQAAPPSTERFPVTAPRADQGDHGQGDQGNGSRDDHNQDNQGKGDQRRENRDKGDQNKSDRDKGDRGRRERSVGIEYQAQPNYYYCGPAATRIALSAAGKYLSQDDLAAKLGTDEGGTDSAVDVTRVLNELTGGGRYRTTEIRESAASPEQIERLRADVVDALDAGDPVVANVNGSAVDTDGRLHAFPGHYVTVVGYRDGGDVVRIADPADAMGEYWMTTGALANWIAERGYSS